MAKDISLYLTDAENSGKVTILDTSIVAVETDTLGSKVTYNDNGARLKTFYATETPATIKAASDVLLDLVEVETGNTVHFNVNRILLGDATTISVGSDTLGTKFTYDTGFNRRDYTVTTDLDALHNAIASL